MHLLCFDPEEHVRSIDPRNQNFDAGLARYRESTMHIPNNIDRNNGR